MHFFLFPDNLVKIHPAKKILSLQYGFLSFCCKKNRADGQRN